MEAHLWVFGKDDPGAGSDGIGRIGRIGRVEKMANGKWQDGPGAGWAAQAGE